MITSYSGDTNDVLFSLYSDDGIFSKLLGQKTVKIEKSTPYQYLFVEADFSSLTLTVGKSYTMVISLTSESLPAIDTYSQMSIRYTSNPYPEGRFYFIGGSYDMSDPAFSARDIAFKISPSEDESDGAAWVQKLPFPSMGQSEPLSFSIYDKGYIGITSDMVDNKGEFWEFDPKSNLLTRKADLPTDGFLFQSPHFVICDKAYIVIGNHLWQYDQVLNKWSRKSDVPGEDKRAAFGFSIGSKGYIGGGFYNGTSLWEYDAFIDQWKQKKDHPVLGYGCNQGSETCSMGGISFTIKNKAYVTGTNMYFWEYNPYQDIWTKKEYVDAVYGQAFAIGNKGYVYNADGVLYEYDYESNLWEQKESLPGNLMCYPGGFAIDGKGYIGVGGLFENNTCTLTANNKLWEFTPTNTTDDKCDESYSAGKQACIDDPLSCGIAKYLIFSSSANPVLQSGASVNVYGNTEINKITLKSGASAKLINFVGNNEVTVQADSTLFNVSRSGATVTIKDSNGTIFTIPATKTAQTIIFNDKTLTLVINNNQVMLGNQVVNLTPSPIL